MEYVLCVGAKGAERLKNVQYFYGEESKHILKKSGLAEGMNVMDAGCGTGYMTEWLAKEVGSKGHVFALDNSQAQIELTQQRLSGQNTHNVSYLCQNITELSKQDLQKIDLFYARLLLVHNPNPLQVLRNLKNNCKKNCLFVLEEPISSESTTYPYHEAFQKHLELYCNLGSKVGLNYDLGKLLPNLVRDADFTIKGLRTVRNFFSTSDAKSIAYQRTKECADKYIQHHLIQSDELQSLQKQLLDLSQDPQIFLSGVTMMQIWGII